MQCLQDFLSLSWILVQKICYSITHFKNKTSVLHISRCNMRKEFCPELLFHNKCTDCQIPVGSPRVTFKGLVISTTYLAPKVSPLLSFSGRAEMFTRWAEPRRVCTPLYKATGDGQVWLLETPCKQVQWKLSSREYPSVWTQLSIYSLHKSLHHPLACIKLFFNLHQFIAWQLNLLFLQ